MHDRTLLSSVGDWNANGSEFPDSGSFLFVSNTSFPTVIASMSSGLIVHHVCTRSRLQADVKGANVLLVNL